MANFGENFKGSEDQTMCPLCKLHIDSQSLLLQCPEVRKELNRNFRSLTIPSIDEIFMDSINENTAKVLKIENFCIYTICIFVLPKDVSLLELDLINK